MSDRVLFFRRDGWDGIDRLWFASETRALNWALAG